jgi:hypothetical protein
MTTCFEAAIEIASGHPAIDRYLAESSGDPVSGTQFCNPDMTPTETDCVAGHVGLELKNVGKNYPFERSRRFPGDKPNRGHRDYSRLSCGGGRRRRFADLQRGH